MLRDRSQWHNWVESNNSDSGINWPDNGYSGDDSTWLNSSWNTGGRWQNTWNGDTSNIPTNSYSSNNNDLLKKNKLLEDRLARLENQLLVNPSDTCDDSCDYSC